MILRQRLTGRVKALFVIALIGSQGLVLWLEHYYTRLCPLYPDKSGGHIYPVQIHGGFIYLTLAEHRTLITIEVLPVVLLMLCIIVERWAKNLPAEKSAPNS